MPENLPEKIPGTGLREGTRWILISGAIFALLAVLLGAFAAHALDGILDANGQQLWHKATNYQMVHALGLVALGLLFQWRLMADSYLKTAAVSFAIGVILFSISLYLLSLTGIRWLGAVVPFGGTAFILGWASLILGLLKTRPND